MNENIVYTLRIMFKKEERQRKHGKGRIVKELMLFK